MILINAAGDELQLTGGYLTPENEIDESTSITASGRLRKSVAGERFIVIEYAVLSGSEYRDLMNFIKAPTDTFLYIPDPIPAEMSISDFPMPVAISYRKKKEAWYAGQVEYVVELEIQSLDYL